MIENKELFETFKNLVGISSPSFKEKKVAAYIKDFLNSLNMEVIEDNTKDFYNCECGNIIGFLPSNTDSKKTILFSSHMDTVESTENISLIETDLLFKTDETTILGGDDKGGIAAILTMLKTIVKNRLNNCNIIVVFTIGEEAGLKGAKVLDLNRFGKISMGYVLDSSRNPGECTLKTPYSAKGDIEIIGRASHSAKPEDGLSALIALNYFLNKFKIGRVDRETTSNIGKISGGEYSNITMENLKFSLEMRSLSNARLDELLEKLNNIFTEICSLGFKINSDVKKGTPGYTIYENEDVVNLYKKSCENLGIKFSAHSDMGGCDANIFNKLGIPTINLGIGMKNIHSKKEFIEKESLINSTKLLLEMISLI